MAAHPEVFPLLVMQIILLSLGILQFQSPRPLIKGIGCFNIIGNLVFGGLNIYHFFL